MKKATVVFWAGLLLPILCLCLNVFGSPAEVESKAGMRGPAGMFVLGIGLLGLSILIRRKIIK